MSNDRVDTNRPEYSWIPFFEELARRLHEDGWRHRQPEIVAELKRMKAEGMVIAGWADNLTDWIDPFSLIGTVRRRITFENAEQIMVGFKAFFGVDSQVPVEGPITPPMENQRSFLFHNVGEDNQADTHWALFEHVMSIGQNIDSPDLADLLNRSINIKWAGHANLSGALFWIKPHSYLKTDTIAHYLGTSNYSDFGQNYLENLVRIREIDSRPFPVLNADAWLTEEFLKNPHDVNMWQVRGGKEFHMVDYFVENEVTAVDFGLNEIDMSQPWIREEYIVESGNANGELSGFQIGETWRFSKEIRRRDLIVMPTDGGSTQIRYGFALSDRPYHETNSKDFRNRRGVIWRSRQIDARDLNLPGAATVQEVGAARDALLSRIVEEESRGARAGSGSGDDDAGIISGDGDRNPDREPRVWVVHADGGKNAADFVEHGDVCIGWNELDLGWCVDLDDIKAEYLDKHPNASAPVVGNQAGSLRRFLFEIQPGDWVLTLNPPKEKTFYYGKVTGGVLFTPVDDHAAPTDGRPCRHRRSTQWSVDVRQKSEIPGQLGIPLTVRELTGGQRDAFLRLVGETPPDRTYAVDTMREEGVFLERDKIERILAQLERKHNLILQGPPGTGKTFLAKKLAYALMGERAGERVADEHFHQSYSYEDFVGGYRPGVNDDKQLIFESQDGAFLRLCRKAREAPPDDKFVMLIDEINRGNLSRVFGELLMLIEADKRSPEYAVELQHPIEDAPVEDGRFFVPPNVYIIGTMNLADKSLTGMNVAMRRRFAFAELEPQFASPGFRKWAAENGMPDGLHRRIVARMGALNKEIAEDSSLDRQYAVGHSFFCQFPVSQSLTAEDWEAWYRDVVEFEIRPLLEEYWFEEPGKAEGAVAELLRGSLEQISVTDDSTAQSTETGE